MKNKTLSENKKLTQKLWIRALRYTLEGDILFKWGYTLPLLRYINEYSAAHVMKGVYEGICENHSNRHSLAKNALQ